AEAFVIFTPADHAILGRDFDEVVVPPAGVAGEDFEGCHLRCLGHCLFLSLSTGFVGEQSVFRRPASISARRRSWSIRVRNSTMPRLVDAVTTGSRSFGGGG